MTVTDVDIEKTIQKLNPLQKAKIGAYFAITLAMRSNAVMETKRDVVKNALDIMSASYKELLSERFVEIISKVLPQDLSEDGMKQAHLRLADVGTAMCDTVEESAKERKKLTEVLKNIIESI